MNRHYPWLLLAGAAILYTIWSVEQEPAPTLSTPPAADKPAGNGDVGSAAALAQLEQRLALLEQRLAILEAKPTGDSAVAADLLADLADRVDYLERAATRAGTPVEPVPSPAGGRTAFIYPEEPQTSTAAEDIRQAFDNDDMAEPALQVELENTQYLFDDPKVADLALREVDCRARYCRLGYEDNSADAAAAAITENELLLLLTEKYGNGITVHYGEREGNYRSLYIELAQ